MDCLCVCVNISHQTPEHQTVLFNHGAIQNIAPLLTAPSYKVTYAPTIGLPMGPFHPISFTFWVPLSGISFR